MEKDETYYEALDKRTKEYKEWKAKREAASEGLGDSVEKITEATGIKAAVKFLAGEDCGCDERKEKLNKIFHYNKPECLTEDEYIWLADFFGSSVATISNIEQRKMLKIYNRVFKGNKQVTSCSPCVRSVYDKLKHYFESYQ